jgi:hypothetical protein
MFCAVHAYADPLGHATGVFARLRRVAQDRRLEADAARFRPGSAHCRRFALRADFLAVAVERLRMEGRLGNLPRLLTLYSGMAARLGEWAVAIPAGRGSETSRRGVCRTAVGSRSRTGPCEHHDGVRTVPQGVRCAR